MTQPITAEARKSAIQAAVQAAETSVKNGQGRADSIRWKGSQLVLPVASVDVNLVLLSRDSHRIKAQLQSLPQADQNIVESDPYGSQAQEIIARLLRETPGYERIRNALANDGQLDAGVITAGGILINANTRAVALRELRQPYIKVVVLPEDAGPKELTELELRLQMEQEVKQDYSFTSQLLFIEDLITSGNYTTTEVGRALRPDLGTRSADLKKAKEIVELELRLLGLIRDVQAASGGAMRFLDFDDKRQALLEVDQDYQRLKNTDPGEAVRIRDAQLAGMIAGVDYRRLREINGTLLDTYVKPALRESTQLSPFVDALLDSPNPTVAGDSTPAGLDLLDDEDDVAAPVAGATSLSGLYTLLAKTKADDDVTITAGAQNVTLPRQAVAAELHSALSTAIENKKRDSRQVDDLSAPMIHLREATRALDKATAAYGDVRMRTGFDRSAFHAALQEYSRAVAEFTTATAAEGTSGGVLGGQAATESVDA